jgi:hypothetical protein
MIPGSTDSKRLMDSDTFHQIDGLSYELYYHPKKSQMKGKIKKGFPINIKHGAGVWRKDERGKNCIKVITGKERSFMIKAFNGN